MKVLFALITTLFFLLVSPAFSQGEDGPDVFPDEYTRKLARELDLKLVREIYIVAGVNEAITIRDPKVIASVIDGLKTAYTTNFSNKVDDISVMDKNGKVLIDYRFSIRHFPELSPELIEGFQAAGIELEGWQEWRERRQRGEAVEKALRELSKWALPLTILGGLAFFLLKRRALAQPKC